MSDTQQLHGPALSDAGADLIGEPMPTKTKPQTVAGLQRHIAMLEETILAGASLLYPEDDWGPRPPGRGDSYTVYLHEGFSEEAERIRDEWKARGWRCA